eukprot:5665867-Pleurochrysis_carterae.AAC.1
MHSRTPHTCSLTLNVPPFFPGSHPRDSPPLAASRIRALAPTRIHARCPASAPHLSMHSVFANLLTSPHPPSRNLSPSLHPHAPSFPRAQ